MKWEHNDSLLDPNNDPYITVVTQSSYSKLTVSSLTQQYVGEYQCIVTNGAGSVKSGKVNITIDQGLPFCLYINSVYTNNFIVFLSSSSRSSTIDISATRPTVTPNRRSSTIDVSTVTYDFSCKHNISIIMMYSSYHTM